MLKHVVMWKFKDEAEGNSKEFNMQYVIKGLSALLGVIPELKDVKLYRDEFHSGGSCDLILICLFDDMEDMLAYQIHPAHVEMKTFIHKVISDRMSADYMIDE